MFDYENPDPRGYHQIVFTVLENVKTQNGAQNGESFNQVLRIELPHVVDMKDLSMYTLSVVNKGTALLLQRPTYPGVWLENYEDIQKNTEVVPCQITIDSVAVNVNKARESEWLTTKVLIMLPPHHRVTVDFEEQDAKIIDGTLEMLVRRYPFDIEQALAPLGADMAKLFGENFLNPGYWHVRFAHIEKKVIKAANVKPSDLSSRFRGMKM